MLSSYYTFDYKICREDLDVIAYKSKGQDY